MSTSYPLRLLAVLACLAVLAGCGGGEGGGSTADNDAAARPASPRPEAAVQPAPSDLSNFACNRRTSGRWRARGDVTNSAAEPMIYTVTVVTVGAGDKVLGERIESLRLRPHQSKGFAWPGFYRGAAEACMPHVERRPA